MLNGKPPLYDQLRVFGSLCYAPNQGNKKRKVDSKGIYNYCKEPGHWKKDCPRIAKNDYVAVMV